MNGPEHSPLPWRVSVDMNSNRRIIADGDGIIIAQTYTSEESLPQAEANAAKLREALEHVAKVAFVDCAGEKRAELGPEMVAIVNAALAEPPRNCDVGTAEEQEERFNAFCERMGRCKRCQDCTALEWRGTNDPQRCLIEWMQMPYEEKKEGGNNGSK